MKLYEEFLNRLDVSVPVIEHHNNWSFVFRTYGEEWKTPFVLMQVQWVQSDNLLGQYFVSFHKALHDGYLNKRYFNKYNDVYVNWDKYDSYFIDWEVRKYIGSGIKQGLTPIYGEKEILFSAWEMFVFTHDKWVSCQSPEFRVYVEGVVDKTRRSEERISSCQNALLYLNTVEPQLSRVYKNEILSRFHNYGHWLGRLLDSGQLPTFDLSVEPQLALEPSVLQ